MSGDNRLRLKTNLFDSLRPLLGSEGFMIQPRRDRFLRAHGGVVDIYQLVCLNAKPGLLIQPSVGLRFDLVERIFHVTSGFEKKYQDGTNTIGSTIGRLQGSTNESCQFPLVASTDLDSVVAEVSYTFTNFALPYYDRYATLAAIDAELNEDPNQPTPNRPSGWLRCSSGIIVARLVGRNDYDSLKSIYASIMERADRGFYFERLLWFPDYLDSIIRKWPSATFGRIDP